MKEKIKKLTNRQIVIGTIVLMFVLLIIGTSYAYFTATIEGNDTAKKMRVEAGTTHLILAGTTGITCNDMYPGDTCSVTFTVRNPGTLSSVYEIDMISVNNSFLNDDLVYTITSNNNGGTKEQTVAPSQSGMLIDNISIAAGVTQTYTLTFTYLNKNEDQNYNENAEFRGKIQINNTNFSLASEIMAYGQIQDAPTATSFQYGEPAFHKGISGQTYKEYEDAWTGSISSSSNKAVGSSYTFNSTTGYFTLSGTTGTSVSYGSGHVGYYTCGSDSLGTTTKNSLTNCYSLLKIEEISGTSLIKATRIRSMFSISGSGLFSAQDDDGTSYYFRGKVDDNYVSFANQLWRIVRINGDGTIRIVSVNSIGNSMFNSIESAIEYTGYTFRNSHKCTSSNPCYGDEGGASNIKTFMQDWYDDYMLSYDNKIAISRFCNDTSYVISDEEYSFGPNDRQNNPTLQCPEPQENFGGSYMLKVGLLSYDEILFAGFQFHDKNSTNYLDFNSTFWTLSPSWFANEVAFMFPANYTTAPIVTDEYAVRPVINLKSDVIVTSGNGTKANPYVIE